MNGAFAVTAFLAAAAIGALAFIYRRDRARMRAERLAVYRRCRDLFEGFQIHSRGIDYPILVGRYRGHDFRIETIIDNLAFRRLPVLWLSVELAAQRPGMASLDILVRSQNSEFFSPANDLEHHLQRPAGWPTDAILKTDDPERLPALAPIDFSVRDFYASPFAKEVLLTARGVRLVWLLDQGRRAEYMVLRRAQFLHDSVPPDVLRDLMDRCIAIHGLVAWPAGAAPGGV